VIPSMWHYDYLFTNPEKLDSPDEPHSREKLDYMFMQKIEGLRQILGYKVTVTSGYRTEAHNKKVGGVAGSSHTKGLAIDILTHGGVMRYSLVKSAMHIGILRIGLNSVKEFVHLDYDSAKPVSLWTY
jgi:zinc D-Ala-D-Ala carboxypeptidase